MAVGKASIQRAASAGKTKTAVIPSPAEEKTPAPKPARTRKASPRKAAAPKTVKKPEPETPKFIPKEENPNKPVQVTEKMPIHLL